MSELDASDILGIVGLALIAVGCWLVAPWLAFVVIGLALVLPLALRVVSYLRQDGREE